MKNRFSLTVAVSALGTAAISTVSAATFYVSLDSQNPMPPFTSWETAAHVIQDAVDAAAADDEVVVTNGIYSTGGRAVGTNILANHVAVEKPLTVRSVNGPQITVIRGAQVPGGGNGVGAVRCVYLADGASLSGFTLANGATLAYENTGVECEVTGGGVLCASTNAVLTNCVIAGNSAISGGGACGGTLHNCTLTSNSATWYNGGGASGSVLHNCTLTSNTAGLGGGGASGSTLHNCTLTENSAGSGGGAASSTLYNCALTGNSAHSSGREGGEGGGAAWSTLHNCVLTSNSADTGGGGAGGSTLNNCTLTRNEAGTGGGAIDSILYNCTLTANSAHGDGGGGAWNSTLCNCTLAGNSVVGSFAMWGGAPYSTLFNCILYYNSGGNYNEATGLHYSCTTPIPTNGVGNIDADPLFVNAAAGDYRLRPDSPCIDAGTNLSSLIQTDITGEVRPWDGNKDGVAAFDIGAYEFRPSPVTLYVSLESTNPVPPYATWETAANVIQDAVDAAQAGDTVLVGDGVYDVGGRETSVLNTDYQPPQLVNVGPSRVVVTNAIRLESVNGSEVTTIDGGWDGESWSGSGVRCVYLGTNGALSGFTLTNGRTANAGGGVLCASTGVVTNCVIIGNVVYSVWSGSTGGGAVGGTLQRCILGGNSVFVRMGGVGGGASGCILHNCLLSGNSAGSGMGITIGGGASGCIMYNCTLSGNRGGGALDCFLYNCTLTGNVGSWGGGGVAGSTLYNCIMRGNSPGSDGTFYNCTVADNLGGISGTAFNCILTGNSEGSGGTFYNCTVIENRGGISGTAFNSIVYYNTGGNYTEGTTLNYCCTSPLPTNGVGNITGPPLFTDMGAGDLRLWEGSPCIDAGTNLIGFTLTATNADTGELYVSGSYACEPTDILGNTRLIDGNGDGIAAWDIGAYEFNSFKPPRFAVRPQRTSEGWTLSITGAPNKWVRLQRSANLQDWEDIWSGLMGAEGAQQVNDSDTGQKVMFYRVVVS